jgi:hypothetical protein
MQKTRQVYRDVRDILGRYWAIYGGLAALLRSPYFHLSIVLTAVTAESWLYDRWWSTSISILPNLLGFTLGGFAIFLGFGDEKFKAIIAGNEPGEVRRFSPYLSVSAAFLHFVVVQVAALLWALVASALYFDLPDARLAAIGSLFGILGGAVGYWLLLYSLCVAVAAGVAIFRVASWYDSYQTNSRT